jgi:hypothetical protein
MRVCGKKSCFVFSIAAVLMLLCGKDEKNLGPAQNPVDLTGQWNGTYNEMALFQTGSSFTGVYEYRCGQINGAVSGTHLTFQWWENAKGKPYGSAPADMRGDGYFDVKAGGDSLVGKWRVEGSPTFDRDWVAVRLSHTPDSAAVLHDCVEYHPDTTEDTTEET